MTAIDPSLGLRRFLMAILLLGLAGSGADLLLLRHHEDTNQLIPLVLIGGALPVLVWHAILGGSASVRALQLTMSLFIVAGFAGVTLHLRSSLEFQREIDPALQGLDLFTKALQAKAPPALAPGVMVQLGLLGLAIAYRHPSLISPHPKTAKGESE